MLRVLAGFFGHASAGEAPLGEVLQPAASPLPPRSSLPYELLVAIEAASVVWRPSRADDDEAGPIVTVVGVGHWRWDGLDDAAARVARSWPELPEAHAKRAAKLIRAQIGRRNRQAFRRKRDRFSDPLDRALAAEHDYFGGVFRNE